MIIWLASYPKSGNTWVRSIITALLYSEDGNFNFELIKKIGQFPEKKYFKELINNFDDFNIIMKNWILAQEKINLSNEVKLFKTHQGKYTVQNYKFTNSENTLASIYIVRDPRNIVKSVSNHFSMNIKDSAKFLLSSKVIGNGKNYEEKKNGIYCLLGRWNDHYRSWTINKKNLLLIKYEDLIHDPEKELNRIIEFLKKYLKFKTNINKNKNILKTTNFKNLQYLETEQGFEDAVENKYTNTKIKFFHLGPENKWENSLEDETKNIIEKNFEKEMLELGYL